MPQAEGASSTDSRPALPTGWVSAESIIQPRFRIVDGTIVVQRGLIERYYAVWSVVPVVWCVSGVIDADNGWSRLVALVAGLGFVALAAWALNSVLRVRLVFDRTGWHWEEGVRRRPHQLSADEVEEAYLFRGPRPFRDFLRTRSDVRVGFDQLLPVPSTRGHQLKPATIDLVCHLQHDLAHQIGVAPIPVRVDLGRTGDTTTFVHPCPACDAP